ncbi:coagulation factor 5/8 type [Actinoallomurus iriomotensis]|uniref:Coagulation factor 5/8 type n=1 Tax=Actinoallomurus iriomotensis TaxID=478107 RepID=A0A9W6SD83_9ACTN|nr:coagulation factor 5/8 type [Actinoallomurus iriomotensis]
MAAVTQTAVAERPSREEAGEPDPALRERLRVLLCCACLCLLATATRPGKIIPDTKIDLPIDPARFLGRALHLWDVEQFGQLQNQAAGYLFPMGPFYVLGHLIGLPAWIVQRFWLALLLCAAFLGTRRLAERLGIGSPGARLAGAMAYALSPHALAVMGINSSEYLPLAMLPWIIVPLATVTRRDGGRIRAAARSGLAVACCGGINATAVLAVVVVPALFVLTRPRGTARVRLLAWWAAAVACATAWWSVPLVLLGRYAFSWLTYTEKAVTTTSSTSLADILRGTERWTNMLLVDGSPWLPLGHLFLSRTLPVLATAAVAALGVAGLSRRGLPERTFLLVTLLLGVTVIVSGHAGPFAGEVRQWIDGPLSPLRNLYKFDGLVRLPLALGLVHLLTPLGGERRRTRPVAAALVALAGVGVSALGTGLSVSGDFTSVPPYWRQATSWLNAHAGNQGVITVPGSRFAEYLWGRPLDEVTEPLMTARWAERQIVPAGSAGLTRLMDAIDQRLTSGQGSAGLTEVLGRMGVRYVLVRNDLKRDDLRGAWPARVHEALYSSPGISRVASFGGVAGTTLPGDAVNTVDQPYPAVEVFEVADADGVVGMTGVDQALRLYGSPEAMLTLADNGLLDGRPVLLDDDDPGAPGRTAVSDSLRRVQRNFGELRGQTSPTMTADERPGRPGDERDFMENAWDRYSTVATYTGIRDVTASSSASDIDSIAQIDDPGALPYAAIDGNPWTRWETGGWNGPVGQWLKVDFGRSVTPKNVTAAFSQDSWLGPPPSRIEILTQSGRVEQNVARTSAAQPLAVAPGPTTWLRVRVLALAEQPLVPSGARVGLSELHVDGVQALRQYRLPAVTGGGTAVMTRAPGRVPACMPGPIRWVCSPQLQRQDEEGFAFDRTFTAPAAARVRLTGTAALTDTALIQRYMSTDPRVTVAASSAATNEPAGMARSAFDGDPATTWIPADGDTDPALALRWRRATVVRKITVRRPPGASGLLTVRVEGDRGQWREGVIGADGVLTIAPMRTARLTLRFPGETPQVTDIVIPHVPNLRRLPAANLSLRCGLGPKLRVNGRTVPTRASGSFADVLAGRPLRFTACRTVRLRAGANTLDPVAFDSFRIDSAVVDPADGIASVPPARQSYVRVTRWTSQARTVEVDAEQESYLTVDENYNAGWRATIGGRTLRSVRLDGWRQAWIVPRGTVGTVRLTYGPDRVYRAALFSGIGLLPLLLLAALWPVRLTPRTVVARRRVGGRAGEATAVLVSAAIGLWSGGVVGVCVAAGAAAFVWTPRRWRAWPLSPWAAGGVLLAASVVALAGARMDGPHAEVFAELLPRLLCLAVVARLAVGLSGAPDRSGAPPARGEPEDRPLDVVEGDGRDRDGQQGDHGELGDEVAGEGSVPDELAPADQDGHLPEEDAVGDAAEESHDAVAENGAHDGIAGRGEGDGADGEDGDQPVQQETELRRPDGVDGGEVGRPGER